jgi:hypothetical protein
VAGSRRIASLATGIVAALRVPQLRQDPLLEHAMRTEALALLGVLDAVCASVDQIAAALVEAFAKHPDYEIITSFPGLADISGAIVLADVGDDRTRIVDAHALQAFAGTGHPRLGQVTHRDSALDEEQPARRVRLLGGLQRRCASLTGARTLPTAPLSRRWTSRRVAAPPATSDTGQHLPGTDTNDAQQSQNPPNRSLHSFGGLPRHYANQAVLAVAVAI